MSYHDSLTKLHNRRFLFEELEKYWRQCIREQKSISVIMIDIDDFKKFYNRGHRLNDFINSSEFAGLERELMDRASKRGKGKGNDRYKRY